MHISQHRVTTKIYYLLTRFCLILGKEALGYMCLDLYFANALHRMTVSFLAIKYRSCSSSLRDDMRITNDGV